MKILSNEPIGTRPEIGERPKTTRSPFQRADGIKDEFLAMITHDLKTPLAPIKAYLDMLMSEATGQFNEAPKERLRIIKSSSDPLLGPVEFERSG